MTTRLCVPKSRDIPCLSLYHALLPQKGTNKKFALGVVVMSSCQPSRFLLYIPIQSVFPKNFLEGSVAGRYGAPKARSIMCLDDYWTWHRFTYIWELDTRETLLSAGTYAFCSVPSRPWRLVFIPSAVAEDSLIFYITHGLAAKRFCTLKVKVNSELSYAFCLDKWTGDQGNGSLKGEYTMWIREAGSDPSRHTSLVPGCRKFVSVWFCLYENLLCNPRRFNFVDWVYCFRWFMQLLPHASWSSDRIEGVSALAWIFSNLIS